MARQVPQPSATPPSILGCITARIVPAAASFLAQDQLIPSIYLLSLTVDPSARGTGLATQLLREALRSLLASTSLESEDGGAGLSCKVLLHVSKTNTRARRLYEKWGLEAGRERRGYYRGLGGEEGTAVEYAGVVTV